LQGWWCTSDIINKFYAALNESSSDVADETLRKKDKEKFTVKLPIAFYVSAVYSISVHIYAVLSSESISLAALTLAIIRVIGTAELFEGPYDILLAYFECD